MSKHMPLKLFAFRIIQNETINNCQVFTFLGSPTACKYVEAESRSIKRTLELLLIHGVVAQWNSSRHRRSI